ncbi:hypothetical protein Trisim1_000319 [Trichoderma cf. simile WF8]
MYERGNVCILTNTPKTPTCDTSKPHLLQRQKTAKKEDSTYNSRCSLMVTHSTTNLPLIGLTLGEQTGPRIFQWIWSYVLDLMGSWSQIAMEGIYKKQQKTYNSRCSLMVTHLTTNLPVRGLSMGEQTGPRILLYLWSYVIEIGRNPLICREL